MPNLTTGTITNSGSTTASVVVVNVNNDSRVNSANITIEVFVGNAVTNKTQVYLSQFTLSPLQVNILTYNIVGNSSWEVQAGVTAPTPTDVVISVFGVDSSGN